MFGTSENFSKHTNVYRYYSSAKNIQLIASGLDIDENKLDLIKNSIFCNTFKQNIYLLLYLLLGKSILLFLKNSIFIRRIFIHIAIIMFKL